MLLEGDSVTVEAPTVSEVAVHFIYLIPALVLLRCRRVMQYSNPSHPLPLKWRHRIMVYNLICLPKG